MEMYALTPVITVAMATNPRTYTLNYTIVFNLKCAVDLVCRRNKYFDDVVFDCTAYLARHERRDSPDTGNKMLIGCITKT